MCKKLENKVALVTGSTSGIGRAIAELFATEGAKVIITGRRREVGEMVVQSILATGGQAAYFQADFEQSQAVRDTVHFGLDCYQRIDILVNNAMSRVISWADGKSTLDMSEEEWDRMLAVGLKASFITCQETIPHMIRQGVGSIITIGSVRSYLPSPRGLAYDVVKSGLINLSKQLNVDFGSYGIRSNLICPGLTIDTPEDLARVTNDPKARALWEPVQTISRVGRPLDIARAALFFASEDSSFIAGAVLVVDGGMSIQSPTTVQKNFEEYYRNLFTG